MKLFENFFVEGNNYYERYFNTSTNSVEIRKINKPNETYIHSSRGIYKDLIYGNSLEKINYFPARGTKKYGTQNPGYTNIRDNYWSPDEPKYNLRPRVWYIDIETTAESVIDVVNTPQELVLIQIYDSQEKTMIVLGSRDWNYREKYSFDYDVKYLNCKSEEGIFNTYFQLIKKLNPMIVCGWNTEGFDYPFLINRYSKISTDADVISDRNKGLATNRLSKTHALFTGREYTGTVEDKPILNKRALENGLIVYKFTESSIMYIDMMNFYKKYAFKVQPSYSLNAIATAELGSTKINHDDYDTFDGFRTGKGYIFPEVVPEEEIDKMMYYAQKDGNQELISEIAWSKFVYYGITDTMLVHDIDKKLQILTIALSVSAKMGIVMSDVLGTVKPWTQYLSNTLYLDNIIMPDTEVTDEFIDIKGGWVMDPVVGKHRWIVSFDFASLYPSVMRAYNMSPETILKPHELNDNLRYVQKLLLNGTNNVQDEDNFINLSDEDKKKIEVIVKAENVCVGGNGVFFRRDKKGVIPTLLEKLYNERKKFKKDMLKYKQMTIDATTNEDKEEFKLKSEQFHIMQMVNKILLNSLYGSLGNKYMPIFNPDIARAVTQNGRISNKFVAHSLNKEYESKGHKNLVISGDTDSVYLQLGKIGDDLIKDKLEYNDKIDAIDNYCKDVLNPLIQNYLTIVTSTLNAIQPELMEEDREAIADVGVLLAKKRYFIRLRDNEGSRFPEDKPYIKRMGIEIVKSSTPNFTKKHLEQAMSIILDSTEDEIRSWLSEVKSQFVNADIIDISKTSSVSRLDYNLNDKGVPINSKSAIYYNMYIKEKGIDNKYSYINPGDKIKFVYTNKKTLGRETIAFLDRNFGETIRAHVDFDKCWDKYMISPLNIMTSPLGWDMNKKTDCIDDW